jgi:hypothetical protein
LLHFTGKDLMNIPFYLFMSMGKMADKVQAKSKAMDTSVFHSGLIRMFVMEELKKIIYGGFRMKLYGLSVEIWVPWKVVPLCL